MSENELINLLKEIKSDLDYFPVYEKHSNAIETVMGHMEELKQYRAIGTVDECGEAMERQRAKKYKRGDTDFLCRVCSKPIVGKYCHNCGQRILWEGVE